jgi:hypothetical protein
MAGHRSKFNTVIVFARGNLNSEQFTSVVDFSVNRETRFSKLDAFAAIETSGE